MRFKGIPDEIRGIDDIDFDAMSIKELRLWRDAFTEVQQDFTELQQRWKSSERMKGYGEACEGSSQKLERAIKGAIRRKILQFGKRVRARDDNRNKDPR